MVTRDLSEKIREYYLKGLEDENFIMEATESTFGGRCYKADRKQDMFDHIDFFWETPKGEMIGIDAKGIKKNRQKDKEFDDTIHWIEIYNVRGNLGWLYGKAKYIAFRTLSDIIYVKLEDLQRFVSEKMKGKQIVTSNPKECYIPYQRYGRKDIIIKAKTDDLREIADFSIKLN